MNDERPVTLSWTPRSRWNVLDMVEILGRSSIPTYLFYDIDLTWAENLRKRLKNAGYRVTITAILLKSIGIAQSHFPETRTARLPWGQILQLNEIGAGFTVEKLVNGKPAVFFGLIKNPDTKSLIQVSSEVNEYAEKEALEIPQLKIEDSFSHLPWVLRQIVLALGLSFPSVRMKYLGASFGLSSLGKLGVRAVIPPCVSAVTFGVGAVEERPVAHNGRVSVCPMVTITLNFDHRLIDGAPAARFMQEVKHLLEGGLSKYVEYELALLRHPDAKQEAIADTALVSQAAI